MGLLEYTNGIFDKGVLVTWSDHVHYLDVRQSITEIFVSVAASHSSLVIM